MKRDLLLSICLAAAALLHFVTAPERFTHAGMAIGTLYIVLGVVQGALALQLARQPEQSWHRVARYLSASLLILFILNQTMGSVIPGIIAEPYSLATIVRKLLEVLVIALSFSSGTFLSKKP